MKHYKIIHKSKVIDVVQNPRFLRFLVSGNVAFTDESSAQGILGSDEKTLYSFKPVKRPGVLVVLIEEISLEEFNRLSSLLNSNQEVCANQTELIKVREETINNLSNICKNEIISGFSVLLSDNKRYSFNLTTEDQINLLNLENQLNSGETLFVYHAAGQPCKVFSREDLKKILRSYRKHLRYHTTYFNVAKHYISTSTDVDKIKSFTYGTPVTGATKDPVLRQILSTGGRA